MYYIMCGYKSSSLFAEGQGYPDFCPYTHHRVTDPHAAGIDLRSGRWVTFVEPLRTARSVHVHRLQGGRSQR